jgi:penicillin amidase
MVVALGPQVKGYGVYPGGQSGNPGSYYYDNMVDTWAQGKLNELLFLRKPDEANKRMLTTWELEK